MRVHSCLIFMNDGVPCHRSKILDDQEILAAKMSINVEVATKQSEFEVDRKLMEPYKE